MTSTPTRTDRPGSPGIERKPEFRKGDPTGSASAWIVVEKTAGGFEVGDAKVIVHETYAWLEDPDGEGHTFEYLFPFVNDGTGAYAATTASVYARSWLKKKDFEAVR